MWDPALPESASDRVFGSASSRRTETEPSANRTVMDKHRVQALASKVNAQDRSMPDCSDGQTSYVLAYGCRLLLYSKSEG